MTHTPRSFPLVGAAGFVAPHHMKTITDSGNRLVAATDPHDAVGVLPVLRQRNGVPDTLWS